METPHFITATVGWLTGLFAHSKPMLDAVAAAVVRAWYGVSNELYQRAVELAEIAENDATHAGSGALKRAWWEAELKKIAPDLKQLAIDTLRQMAVSTIKAKA